MGIGNIGWTEFIVILAFALIFFGPRRLPGIANTLGKSLREFQKALNEVRSEIAQAGREADVRETAHRTPPQRQSLPAGPLPAADQPTAEGAVGDRREGTGEVPRTVGEQTPDTATGPVATAAALSARTAAEPEPPADPETGKRTEELAGSSRGGDRPHDAVTEPGETASGSDDAEASVTPPTPARPDSGDGPSSEETDPEGARG